MKLPLLPCLLFVLVLGAENDTVRGAATNDTPRVGRLREFDRFAFEGDTTFSPTNLWYTLNSTVDFPELSHPLAPRDVFLAAISRQLQLGYLHCGFPDSQIIARYDPSADRVVVQIKEGPRYLCGSIEIIGARKIPIQPIVTALTTTNADSDVLLQPFQFLDNAPANKTAKRDTEDSNNRNSMWVVGQPTHFDNISLRHLSSLVTNTLVQNGFFSSQFNLNIVSNAATRTATLQVNIIEEGPLATIDRIKVVGNWLNSREQLLTYLGLQPGMKYSSSLTTAITDRLYHSARFLTNSVSAGRPDASGRLTLTIEVIENDQGPLLNGAFTPIEETMLKARTWLAKVGETRDEAVLSVTGYPDAASTLQCILSPRQGFLILDNEVVAGTNRLRRAIVASAIELGLYVPARREKFMGHFLLDQMKSFVCMETKAPDENGNSGNISFGAGFSRLNDTTNAPPFALSVRLDPAAFVRLAHGTDAACWFDGEQLIRSNAGSVLKLEAKTSRFIEWTGRSEAPDNILTKLHFEPGAYATALARIEREGSGFKDVYQTNDPLGSAVAIFGSELVQIKFVDSYLRTQLPDAICAQLPTLLRQLSRSGIFGILKDFYDATTAPDDTTRRFAIPNTQPPSSGETANSWLLVGGQWLLGHSDELLPVGSWPWTLTRDIARLARGQMDYLALDTQGIYDSSATGSLGYLVTAQLLKEQNAPGAKAMAARGLERLSANDFRRDCQVFLDENKLCGRLAVGLAGTVCNLDGPELDALLAPMPPVWADFIQDCARRLHTAKKDQPLIDTIAPALDTIWEKELKRETGDSLRKIANE